MRKFYLLLAVVLSIFTFSVSAKTLEGNTAAQIVKEIKVGWNLGNVLDATGGTGLDAEASWGTVRATQEQIDAVKAAGFNAVRVPVSWGIHTKRKYVDNQLVSFEIDPAWMDRVKEVVDYCINDDMFVIINLHHDCELEYYWPTSLYQKQNSIYVSSVWEQISEVFKDYDQHLIFETLNEPHLTGQWTIDVGNETLEDQDVIASINEMNAIAVSTIRNSGGNNADRVLMCPGMAASQSGCMSSYFELPADVTPNRIALSLHAYEPYAICFDPAYSDLTNDHKVFLTNYFTAVKEKFIDNGIPVVIGETSATNKGYPLERMKWAEYYFSLTSSMGMPAFLWDNGLFYNPEEVNESHGHLDKAGHSWYDYAFIQSIMSAVYNKQADSYFLWGGGLSGSSWTSCPPLISTILGDPDFDGVYNGTVYKTSDDGYFTMSSFEALNFASGSAQCWSSMPSLRFYSTQSEDISSGVVPMGYGSDETAFTMPLGEYDIEMDINNMTITAHRKYSALLYGSDIPGSSWSSCPPKGKLLTDDDNDGIVKGEISVDEPIIFAIADGVALHCEGGDWDCLKSLRFVGSEELSDISKGKVSFSLDEDPYKEYGFALPAGDYIIEIDMVNMTVEAKEKVLPKYTVTTSCDSKKGTVTGGGEYNEGRKVTVTADAKDGYKFVKWDDDVTDNPRVIRVTKDTVLTALFEELSSTPNSYQITVSCNTSMGTVTGGGEYSEGDLVTLVATPKNGYKFVEWSNGNTNSTYTFVPTKDLTLTAEFRKLGNNFDPLYLMGSISGHEWSAYVKDFIKIEDTDKDGVFEVSMDLAEAGYFVILTDGAKYCNGNWTCLNGYRYRGLTNGINIADGPVSIEANSDDGCLMVPAGKYTIEIDWNNMTIVAKKEAPVVYSVLVSYNSAMGTVTGAGEYEKGESVILKATARPGYKFVKWSDDVTESLRTIKNIDDDVTLSVVFEALPTYNVSVSCDSDKGTVTGSGEYAEGYTATITATAKTGYKFVKWSDNVTTNPREIEVTKDTTITALFEKVVSVYTITATCDASEGTVTGSGEYEEGTTATIEAVAKAGYKFVKWSDNVKTNPRDITVTKDVALEAVFEEDVVVPTTYSITVSYDNTMGTVTGAGEYEEGQSVTLTATPKAGYEFVKWSNDVTKNPYTFTPTKDVELTAVFKKTTSPVVLSSVVLFGDGIPNSSWSCPAVGLILSDDDQDGVFTGEVVITEEEGYFGIADEEAVNCTGAGFADGCWGCLNQLRYMPADNGTNIFGQEVSMLLYDNSAGNAFMLPKGEYVIEVDKVNMTVVAKKKVVVVPTYTVSVSYAAAMGTATGAGEYEEGTEVVLTATAKTGYEFVKWSDNVTTNPRTITVTEDFSVTALFEKVVSTYTVIATCAATEGTVTGSGEYEEGTIVTIEAVAKAGYKFVKWSDNVKTNPREITVTKDVTLEAVFVPVYTVTATCDASEGTVTGSGEYEEGETVTIESVAKSGYKFVKWSDNVKTNPRKITVTKDITLEAVFVPVYTVTATCDASEGTVTGSGEYEEGTTATIEAVAKAGYKFVKWSDNVKANPREITVTKDVALEAVFVSVYTVTLSCDDEMGTVVGNGVYEEDEVVTINATPKTGYKFVKWSDGVTTASREITVTKDVALEAEFEKEVVAPATYIVSVSYDDEMGTVTGAGEYEEGETVILVATAKSGYKFVKWSDKVSINPREMVVTEDITLSAIFEKISVVPTVYEVSVTCDSNMGTVEGSGEYTEGETATVTAAPNEGYKFVGWSDGTTENPYTFEVTKNVELTAEFEKEKVPVVLSSVILFGDGIPGSDWVCPPVGIELTDDDQDGVFTGKVKITKSVGYFAMVESAAVNCSGMSCWETMNNLRYAPEVGGQDISEGVVPYGKYQNDDKSFSLPAGEYIIEVDKVNMTIVAKISTGNVNVDSDVVISTEYIDMLGRKVEKASRGVYLVKYTYESGKTEVKKVILVD